MKSYSQVFIMISVLILTQCKTAKPIEPPQIKTVVTTPQKQEPDLNETLKAQLEAMLMGQPNSPRYLDTETIGILDFAHIREYAHLIVQLKPLVVEKMAIAAKSLDKRFLIQLRSGQFSGLTASTLLEVDLNERPKPIVNDLIRDIAFVHSYYVEMRQGDTFPPTFLSGSSFSYEDLQSNRVGIEIGIRSLENHLTISDTGLEVLVTLKPKNCIINKPKTDQRSYSYIPNLKKTIRMPEVLSYTPPVNLADLRILGIRKLKSNWQWRVANQKEVE